MEGYINVGLKETQRKGAHCINLVQDWENGRNVTNTEMFGRHKIRALIDWLRNCQLVKKDSAPQS